MGRSNDYLRVDLYALVARACYYYQSINVPIVLERSCYVPLPLRLSFEDCNSEIVDTVGTCVRALHATIFLDRTFAVRPFFSFDIFLALLRGSTLSSDTKSRLILLEIPRRSGEIV